MTRIIELAKDFWTWTGLPQNEWGVAEIDSLPEDVLYYPKFLVMRQQCIGLVNTQLSPEEMDAFLLGLAIDNEAECILDYCKEYANDSFVEQLLSAGIVYPQWEARWQLAELLSINPPRWSGFLARFLVDENEYVRRRARFAAKDADTDNAGPGYEGQ